MFPLIVISMRPHLNKFEFGGLEVKISTRWDWRKWSWRKIEISEEKNTFKVKMKIFQTAKRKFAILGLDLYHPTQNLPCNRRIVSIYLIYVWSFISSIMYLYHDAHSFEEYTISIYITSAAFILLLFLTITIYNEPTLFKFIANGGNSFDRGKLNSNSGGF